MRTPRWWTALPLTLVLPLLAAPLLSSVGRPAPGDAPLTCRVTRQEFVAEILAKGEIQSAANTEVRCEVRSRDGWIRILEVVDEGTYVRPGDFLMRLDSSRLEDDRRTQEIVCAKAQAAVIEARSNFQAAEAAQREYLHGEYELQRQTLEAARVVAEEQQRQASRFLDASRKLALRGFVTAQQLEADQFALRAADTDLRLARQRLEVLEKYSKPRMLAELQSAVAVAKSQAESAEYTAQLNQKKLDELDDQIRKCEIRAPVAGEVVLAHMHHEGHSHMIQAGEETREHRVMVRLPDPSRMQVKAKIGEDKVASVRPGMPVTIQLEAFPGAELRGAVTKVNEYPEPSDWFTPVVKQYVALVSIDDPLEDMRPGLSAELKICVERLEGQLQVPNQSMLRHGEQTFCITHDTGRFEAHEVALGSDNGRRLVVRSGLAEGQQVVLRPAAYRDRVELPN